jgi:hypothetical protein
LLRTSAGWNILFRGSDPPPCRRVPLRVADDLLGRPNRQRGGDEVVVVVLLRGHVWCTPRQADACGVDGGGRCAGDAGERRSGVRLPGWSSRAAAFVRAPPRNYRCVGRYLAIYLNDHLAGSFLGGELARRALRENLGTPLGGFLEWLVAQIDEDRATLLRLMDGLGVERSRVKPALAVAAERLGRLKLNGHLTTYSPLSRVLELEWLAMGVMGKRAMWRAFRELPSLAGLGFDFAELERRAEEQLGGLERQRLETARQAF